MTRPGATTGAGVLLRMQLRRDWWQVLAWAAGIAVLYLAQAVSVDGLYADQQEFDRAAAAMQDNAAFVAMAGPARALNTVGGQVFWQSSAFGAVLIGVMAMLLVVRHTRAEEESGRDELLRSAPVGRLATPVAALVVSTGACLIVGLAVTAGLLAYRLDAGDSWATGLGLAVTGWAFAGVALLAAQLVASARAAYGITGGVLGLAYGLRAVGDVGAGTLSWLSPIGWYQGVHAFSGVRWWPLLLPLAATAATLLAARFALGRRDAGSGVLAQRSGPSSGRLGSGLALSWRLQRGSVAGWAVGLGVFGFAYGTIGDDVGTLIGDSTTARDVFAPVGDLVDGFYGAALAMLGLIATGFSVSSALRARAEEDDGRIELLLATGLSRRRWLAGHLVVTTLGTLAVVAAGGVGLGSGFAVATGRWDRFTHLAAPALAYLLPALLCAGVAFLLVAVAPRASSAAWGLLCWSAVVLLLGPVLRLPEWLEWLSPFHHVPVMPAESMRILPLAGLAAVILGLALAVLRLGPRRDVG